jgi:hypothetical protein
VPNVLVVGPHVKAASVADLIADAKANPGKRNMGSNGVGTTLHLSGELFQLRTATTLTHIPFKGWGDCVVALMRGDVDIMFDNVSTALPNISGGKFRPLAVVRDHGAGGHAASGHRYAEHGIEDDHGSAGGAQADRAAGHGRDLLWPGRSGKILERRNQQVGGRHQGGKSCHAIVSSRCSVPSFC